MAISSASIESNPLQPPRGEAIELPSHRRGGAGVGSVIVIVIVIVIASSDTEFVN